ncbi:hypothetical protein V6U81_05775 [Micromonospora sp. CPCC 205711]|uniref:hypothetical protein n=1 Tax=Micromonospora sp. CPCC 205547 TaxID=3122400 RepID=UPI002FF2A71E
MMSLSPSQQSLLAVLVPLASSLLTAIVAVAAVVASRKSSRDTVEKDLRLSLWEKRNEIYIELLVRLDKQDPSTRPAAAGMRDKALSGEVVSILRQDPHSKDWKNFEAKLRAYASKDVWTLYSIWLATLGTWTFLRSACLTHIMGDREKFDSFSKREDKTRDAILQISRKITHYVRAELRFERVKPVKARYKPGPLGGIEDVWVAATGTEEDFTYQEPPFVINMRKEGPGWSFRYALPPGATFADWIGGSPTAS